MSRDKYVDKHRLLMAPLCVRAAMLCTACGNLPMAFWFVGYAMMLDVGMKK
jgi:hypothetical protein